MATQGPGPALPGHEDDDEKDCVMCTVLKDGVCKPEFIAFDTCYDASQHTPSRDESHCMPLDQFISSAVRHSRSG
ncbi:hypothetical protein FOA52_000657 [Chlamydomonas sp. UWO 241]|nr:hypothetical protein FOA52_000657 [Chlamydomonas sp. UWO 241]